MEEAVCICGATITMKGMGEHKKTLQHISYIESLIEEDICSCGSQITPGGMKKHLQTKKHKNLMDDLLRIISQRTDFQD